MEMVASVNELAINKQVILELENIYTKFIT